MIESVSDAIQLAVLAACFVFAIVRALRARNTMWVSFVCFYGCMLLGNAYWLGYLLVFGETPRYSYIAEMAWIAAYLFLLMLLIEADRCRGMSALVPAAWVPVAVCGICCVYYIASHGSPFLNLADNGLLAAIGYFSVRGVASQPPSGTDGNRLADNKAFHVAALVFVVVEQALWLSSCFLEPGPISSVNAYIVLGFALTLSLASILVCAWGSDSA